MMAWVLSGRPKLWAVSQAFAEGLCDTECWLVFSGARGD